jgi:type IX secretion system PorP/SprF family membrane protein
MRIKRNYILLGLFLLLSLSCFSQQDPMYTSYMNDPILINPAYAGSRGDLSINGVFRKQWVGLEWQPTTTAITINSPFLKQKVGIGFSILNDQIGPMKQSGIYFDYAYHIHFTNSKNLSFGLKAGFNNVSLNIKDLTTTEWDEYVQGNIQPSRFLPNFGIGAYYFTNFYYVGFSIPMLVKNSLEDKSNTLEIVGKEDRTYILTGGLLFDIIPPLIKFKPTFLARAIFGAPPSVEVSATVIIYDRVWFGLLYRFGDAIAASARVQINNQLQIGYSYDLTSSQLRPYNKGTHEIMINYVFSHKGQRILSPRYF